MTRLIASRLRQSIIVLWAVTSLTFILVRVIGDPARLILGEGARPESVAELRSSLGLNDPFHEQYIRFLSDALQGNFGDSIWTGQPVTTEIFRVVPRTIELAAFTILVVLIISVGLGLRAGARPESVAAKVITFFSFTAVSLPEFWFGLMLIIIFSVELGILPTSGHGTWQHLVLPVATLMILPTGRLAQTTKKTVQETLTQDFILTARAKGLTQRRIEYRHALPNSLLGVITLAGDELASLVAGVVIVETIFGWPGLGSLSILAIRHRDPFLLLGIVVFVGFLIVVVNLLVDVVYAMVDPRIRARWSAAERNQVERR